MLKVLEKYTKKLLIGNKIKADMNNILTMLVRWLKNYFFISEEEMNRRLGVTEDDLSGFDEVEIE